MDLVASELVEKTSEKIAIWCRGNGRYATPNSNHVTCPLCRLILHLPVTLHCGHTFCKLCVEHSRSCKVCGEPTESEKLSVNVALAAIVSELYPESTRQRSLMGEGDSLAKVGSFTQAISKFDECLKIDENCAIIYSKKSRLFAKMSDYVQSNLNANRAIALDKACPEGYLDKSNALMGLRDAEGALVHYLACCGLDLQQLNVLEKIKEIVFNLLSNEIQQQSYERSSPELIDRRSSLESDGNILELYRQGQADPWADNSDCQPISASHGRMVISQTVLNGILRDFGKRIIEKFDETFDFDNTTCGEGNTNIVKSHAENSIDSAYFECSLCIRVFLDPVCTTCGHEFCRECLQRSMDHTRLCPLCKRELDFKSTINLEMDSVMNALIEQKSSFLNFNERKLQYKNEIALFKQSLPIFVCTIAFPTVSCPLRIFEPRYRLLLRRAKDIHDNCFGITIPCTDKPFEDVGTVIRTKHVHFFPDGHSIIQAVGTRRFRVLSYDSLDGYNTARIEFITDEPIVGTNAIEETKSLMDEVYKLAKSWWSTHCENSQYNFVSELGPFPKNDYLMGENGPNWMWFILAATPLSNSFKLRILKQSCLRRRLRILQRILTVTN